jgi:hypothetical protein
MCNCAEGITAGVTAAAVASIYALAGTLAALCSNLTAGTHYRGSSQQCVRAQPCLHEQQQQQQQQPCMQGLVVSACCFC